MNIVAGLRTGLAVAPPQTPSSAESTSEPGCQLLAPLTVIWPLRQLSEELRSLLDDSREGGS
jgi:hypothetical protein